MEKMIPAAKMSKKKKRELQKTKRETWMINPRERVRESKKIYNRKRSHQGHEDWPDGIFRATEWHLDGKYFLDSIKNVQYNDFVLDRRNDPVATLGHCS